MSHQQVFLFSSPALATSIALTRTTQLACCRASKRALTIIFLKSAHCFRLLHVQRQVHSYSPEAAFCPAWQSRLQCLKAAQHLLKHYPAAKLAILTPPGPASHWSCKSAGCAQKVSPSSAGSRTPLLQVNYADSAAVVAPPHRLCLSACGAQNTAPLHTCCQ